MLDTGRVQSPLDAFRDRLRQEESWQTELAKLDDVSAFAAAASRLAASAGLDVSPEVMILAAQPDPLGLDRLTAKPPNAEGWPAKPWLPIGISPGSDQFCVDWAHFGDNRLTESFFEDSVRRTRWRPLNRFAPYRTGLEALLDEGDADAIEPTGFIFHMSRCGSTLAAQMLAASSRNIVVSEAAPLDTVVQLHPQRPDLPEAGKAALLRGMVRALGRRRFGEDRYFIKLDSWHILALPLFRRAFPNTPWVFLYRDPTEVMVSQMAKRGVQTVPGGVPVDLYGITDGVAMPPEEYCARVLGRVCAAALEGLSLGGGALVNYSELPAAIERRVLPHFGVTPDASELDAMRQASRQDAKTPQLTFEGDVARKRKAATPAIAAAVETHIGLEFFNLERIRLDDQPV